jgi:hypothetical protein
MSRIATVNYTKVVTRCGECPFFDNHPHEPECQKLYEILKENNGDIWLSIVNRNTLDSRCPLPFSEDKR